MKGRSRSRLFSFLFWISHFCRVSKAFLIPNGIRITPTRNEYPQLNYFAPFPQSLGRGKSAANSRSSATETNYRRESYLLAGTQDPEETDASSEHRRKLLTASPALLASLTSTQLPQPAHGVLIQFPVTNLKNRYHFLRAGLSELEADNIFSTNALFLTNEDNQMVKDAATARSIVDACNKLRASGNPPTVVYHSLAMNGMNTGDMVATELKLGRDRLLPEFTYLDPRGIGLWDSSQYDSTKKAMAALDYYEGGPLGMTGRPPANTDGTPNETLGDQFIRLRQFLSLQESRTSGENILVIFPDGTGPALLSCMIGGLPYNECHCLEFAPGEVRLEITYDSVRKLFQERRDNPAYMEMVKEGQVELEALRQQGKQYVGRKEQRAEEERQEIEESFAQKKQEESNKDREKNEQLARRQEEERLAAEERRRERDEKDRKMRQEKEEKERQMAAKKEAAAAERAAKAAEKAAEKQALSANNKDEGGSPAIGLAAGGLAAILGIGTVTMGGSDEEPSGETLSSPPDLPTAVLNNSTALSNSTSSMSSPAPEMLAVKPDDAIEENNAVKNTTNIEPHAEEPVVNGSAVSISKEEPLVNGSAVSSSAEREPETDITASDIFLKAYAKESIELIGSPGIDLPQDNGQTTNGSSILDDKEDEDTLTEMESTEIQQDEDMDDAWLRVLSEIRDEDDD